MSFSLSEDDARNSIAIISLEAQYPGATNAEKYWHNIDTKKDVRRLFSEEELRANGVSEAEIKDPDYIRSAYVLDDIALFDAGFFNIAPHDAEIMDPQQRLMLEAAYLCLETGGYQAEDIRGRLGVFVGAAKSSYFLQNYNNKDSIHKTMEGMHLALMNESIATYIAYKLNATGPAVSINTTCSSSLVAVHQACSSLLYQECDIALAGGVSIDANQMVGYLYREGWLASATGYCLPFDNDAKGTVPGNGLGLVLLKRLDEALKDKDIIHAIIRGSAINNDGADKVGYTAPSVLGQARVITDALVAANVNPRDISLVEAHGTGTPIGDPIEIAALTKAYSQWTHDHQFCAIGSVKGNIGHCNSASGVAGLIKIIRALETSTLPPSMHFKQSNSKIAFTESPFYVNTETKPWLTEQDVKYAAVSSFGIGGDKCAYRATVTTTT